jgi:hypothetical protein
MAILFAMLVPTATQINQLPDGQIGFIGAENGQFVQNRSRFVQEGRLSHG